uniref:Putative inactive cadmium/zinc-transporting ATPase HMA3 n=1 Tax=Tanacetum cinerariifolium TaxID=118510 RepID=A0A699H976_TANCI|nr:putative inactive cadmium/zinc-transporting ATPase HMA3 [Tanacetum cinerariifolium]
MAAALIDYAQSHSVEAQPDNVEEFENFPGEGIYGKIEGKIVTELELSSFQTLSKGFSGEYGQRGGHFEMTNIRFDSLHFVYIWISSKGNKCDVHTDSKNYVKLPLF